MYKIILDVPANRSYVLRSAGDKPAALAFKSGNNVSATDDARPSHNASAARHILGDHHLPGAEYVPAARLVPAPAARYVPAPTARNVPAPAARNVPAPARNIRAVHHGVCHEQHFSSESDRKIPEAAISQN